MKKYIRPILGYILAFIAIYQMILIGGYCFFHSWFLNADLGSILGVREDYSLQLTHDGELWDSKQGGNISRNITRYILVNIPDLEGSNSHDILIMEEGKENPPVYIIYDDMLEGYIFINKVPHRIFYNKENPNEIMDRRPLYYDGRWVGGYQELSETDEFVQKRYKSFMDKGEWIVLNPVKK